MLHQIQRHPVQLPLLQSYIKFFWELRINQADINHRIIPQRNINLRFNLNDTSHYAVIDGKDHLLDDLYFSGLQDKYRNFHLKLKGDVHVLGVCFYPEGFYPFFQIPVHEFRNQLLGANDFGLRFAREIGERLKEKKDIRSRITLIEDELAKLLLKGNIINENFSGIFNCLKEADNTMQISEFCNMQQIGIRSLERMYNKYIGISASSYCTLNRFHKTTNQLLNKNYQKLSDLALDNGYFDQMHFIRDFKRFTGHTPRRFIQENNSILQIGKLS